MGCCKNCSKCLEKVQKAVSGCLEGFFFKWGKCIANRPILTLLLSLFILGAFGAGWGLRKQFENENEVWTPSGNQALIDKNRIEDIFSSNLRPVIFYLVSKNQGQNVLTKPVFQQLKALDDQVRGLSFMFKSQTLRFQDICEHPNPNDLSICLYINHPLQFYLNSSNNVDFSSSFTSTAQLLSVINNGRNVHTSQEVTWQALFGGSKLNSSNQIEQALAMNFYYFTMNVKDQDAKYIEFDKEVEKVVDAFNEAPGRTIRVQVQTLNKLLSAFQNSIGNDLLVLQIAIVLIVVYCLFTVGLCSPRGCRTSLALIGVISSGLAFVAGSGFASLLGFRVAGIHNILPFLVLGIGVDDMFVITATGDSISMKTNVKRRFARAISYSGAAISITSLTNCIAFFVGTSTSLPALRSFCAYAGFGILFDLLFQVSFFAAAYYLDMRRQMNGKGDWCGGCCCKQRAAICCKGKLSPYLFEGSEVNDSEGQDRFEKVQNGEMKGQKAAQAKQQEQEEDQVQRQTPPSWIGKCIDKCFSRFIINPVAKIILIICIVAFTAVNVWAVTQLEVFFTNQLFVPNDHSLQKVFDIRDEHFKTIGQNAFLYTDGTDFTNPNNIDSFVSLLDSLQTSSNVIDNSIDSWVVPFKTYRAANCNSVTTGQNNQLKTCIIDFYQTNAGAPYRNNFKFTDNDILLSTRSSIILTKTDGGKDSVDLMQGIRKTIDSVPAMKGTIVYVESYLDYEQLAVFDRETLYNLVGALIAVFIVILITNGNIIMSIYVVLCIGLTDLDVLALSYYWGLTLNAVTVVNIVLAVGLAVDYSAHIAHSYLEAKCDEAQFQKQKAEKQNLKKESWMRVQKVKMGLGRMGGAVIHGAISTFIAILTLSLSQSYIFQTFFKMVSGYWFGIIVFGMINGFIVLPIILTFIGPLKESDWAQKENKKKIQSDSKTFQEKKEDEIELSQNVIDNNEK